MTEANPLLVTIEANTDEVVCETLVASGQIYSREILSEAMFHAAYRGRMRVVEKLLECGADIDWVHGGDLGRTALLDAIEHNHFEVAKLLIKMGADIRAVDRWGSGALAIAITAEWDAEALWSSAPVATGDPVRRCGSGDRRD